MVHEWSPSDRGTRSAPGWWWPLHIFSPILAPLSVQKSCEGGVICIYCWFRPSWGQWLLLDCGPPDPNVWGCATLYCLLGNLHAIGCLCTGMHFQFSGMCNNVDKTRTYVKDTVIKALTREVKLKSTVGCRQIHRGSSRAVHMVADEKLGSAYRTRNIRGTVVRSKTRV